MTLTPVTPPRSFDPPPPQINYYLDEPRAWALDIPELRRSLDEARADCVPRLLVVINPGNPTGSVLTRQNIEDIIRFAFEQKLIIMADEVGRGWWCRVRWVRVAEEESRVW